MPKTQTRIPLTPVRRLFCSRKARSAYDYGELDPVVDTPKAATAVHIHCRPPGGVALQNEDTDEDAIIVTALDVIPFCCHEHLLSMSHAELVTVGTILNEKLPRVLAINLAGDLTFIRNSIEVIVGLRRFLPASASVSISPSPSAPSTPSDAHVVSGSPCSTRLSTRGTPKLMRLDEEDEDDVRPSKRTSARRASYMSSPTPRQRPRTVTQPRRQSEKSENIKPGQADLALSVSRTPVATENRRKDVYGLMPSASVDSDIFK